MQSSKITKSKPNILISFGPAPNADATLSKQYSLIA